MAIDIKTELVRLVSLQEHDLRLHSLTEKLADIPVRLSEVTKEADAVRAELEALTATKLAQEAEKRDLEGDVAVANEHLASFESKLFSIKTNKEYQAALKARGVQLIGYQTIKDRVPMTRPFVSDKYDDVVKKARAK